MDKPIPRHMEIALPKLGKGPERALLCWSRVTVRRAGLQVSMTSTRRIFLNLVFFAFIAGSTYDIATDQEHWPFSQYPMFSEVWRSPTFSWLRLFGVTQDGREFPLDENRYVRPFDQSRLPKALRRMRERPDGESRLRIAIADCLARYEVLRMEGVHDGPPLTAMRLYELEWTIDPQAGNVDSPERQTFIAEVRR